MHLFTTAGVACYCVGTSVARQPILPSKVVHCSVYKHLSTFSNLSFRTWPEGSGCHYLFVDIVYLCQRDVCMLTMNY